MQKEEIKQMALRKDRSNKIKINTKQQIQWESKQPKQKQHKNK